MFKYRFTAQSVDAMCSKSKQTMNQTSLSPMSQINSCLCSRQREKEVRAAPETEVMDSTLLNESVTSTFVHTCCLNDENVLK